jgi:asparagine synthase (glutamine-hydrolysing)
MCGILGLTSAAPIEQERFQRALDSLENRGPDAQGVTALKAGHVMLGHRRLAIIDLSADGNQPMHNHDQSLWLIFNGEIYNYIELRKELQAKSCVFSTQSDSEVILHAYEEWGERCLERFRGIFSFAIYNAKADSFFLARDHFGTKPLYHLDSKDGFAFASQASTINLALGRSPEIDEYWLNAYLIFGNIPGAGCIYSGIKKLPPGCFLRYDGRSSAVVNYKKSRQIGTGNLGDASSPESIKKLIEESLYLNQRSDVPVAYLLSGGVDSSILCSIAQQASSNPIRTFSVGFYEPESDESEHALKASELIGTDHEVAMLSLREALKLIPSAIKSFDEPFNINGLIPYSFLCEFVRSRGFKVAIGGDGADEIFGGYLWHEKWWNSRNRYWPENRSVGTLIERFFRPKRHESLTIEYLDIFLETGGGIRRGALENLGLYDARAEYIGDVGNVSQASLDPDLLPMSIDQEVFLPDHCLTKVDRVSMSHGLEVRVPFLDQALTHAIGKLSAQELIAKGERKHLLKMLFSNNLGGLNLSRKKGFSSPLSSWWNDGLGNLAQPVFENSTLARENELVRKLIGFCCAQEDTNSLVNLLSLCL